MNEYLKMLKGTKPFRANSNYYATLTELGLLHFREQIKNVASDVLVTLLTYSRSSPELNETFDSPRKLVIEKKNINCKIFAQLR